ncbi:hypothetical protein OH76DRAFT_1403598 [Lentinus brumalis]|uniref:Uncharacterized protein n=1 Tax=Lentinus brumalis TaxID=2498619 RepID=A0A371DA21_9APHY|nr:hypothetical protein OH76DRAFT_1403598 [Polyporus brumalis]
MLKQYRGVMGLLYLLCGNSSGNASDARATALSRLCERAHASPCRRPTAFASVLVAMQVPQTRTLEHDMDQQPFTYNVLSV